MQFLALVNVFYLLPASQKLLLLLNDTVFRKIIMLCKEFVSFFEILQISLSTAQKNCYLFVSALLPVKTFRINENFRLNLV